MTDITTLAIKNMTDHQLLLEILDLLPKVLLGASFEEVEQEYSDSERHIFENAKIELGLDFGLFAVNMCSFLITFLYCASLIRHIFVWKAVTLALTCICKSIPIATAMWSKHQLHDTAGPHKTFEVLELIFESYHQFLTAFLHLELHRLVCKLERRERDMLRFLASLALALLVVGAVIAIEYGLQAVWARFDNTSIFRLVLYELKPLFTSMNVVFTGVTLYWGHQSFVALRKSDLFREQSGVVRSRNKEHDFVVAIIVTSVTFQALKIIVLLARLIMDAVLRYHWALCIENAISAFLSTDCNKSVIANFFLRVWIFRILWCHLFEQIVVNVLILRRTWRS